jgi:hypothetical protein
MSKKAKLLRIEQLQKENEDLINKIKKLCNQYNYNEKVIRALYVKSQIDKYSIPDQHKIGNYSILTTTWI